jgi:predicted GIY-YIG superfamily endonuclease
MAVYVLHIEPPYRHAAHYIGFTTRPDARVAEHLAGRGSPLIRAALAAGHEVNVSLKWHCGTRAFERYLKNQKGTRQFCPRCNPKAKRVTFAAFCRFLAAGGKVRPSRRYFALAAFAGVEVAEVIAMSALQRRALDERMKKAPAGAGASLERSAA